MGPSVGVGVGLDGVIGFGRGEGLLDGARGRLVGSGEHLVGEAGGGGIGGRRLGCGLARSRFFAGLAPILFGGAFCQGVRVGGCGLLGLRKGPVGGFLVEGGAAINGMIGDRV